MVDVTVRKLKNRKPTKSRIVKKRVPTAPGETITIRSIPANGPAFKDDFLRAFAANVRAARKAAKKQPA